VGTEPGFILVGHCLAFNQFRQPPWSFFGDIVYLGHENSGVGSPLDAWPSPLFSMAVGDRFFQVMAGSWNRWLYVAHQGPDPTIWMKLLRYQSASLI